MGTTVVAALALGEHLFIAHVGDSRVYLSRGGELHQLTRDHSLVEELKQLGKIDNLEQVKARYRNAVTRAVGVYETVQPDTLDLIPQAGDAICCAATGFTTRPRKRNCCGC
ncbi:MAG: serine/threonine-protein phosphatase [Deltaproteobacteria bacterium]|nr:serine/threonine-protein phosphatase [Deltaproteobacteria bacterium]